MKKSIIISILALAFIVSGAYALTIKGTSQELDNIQYEVEEQNLGGSNMTVSRYRCQTATTSPEYITAGKASTTCDVMGIDSSELAYINAMVYSSTTVPFLSYVLYQSNDEVASTRNWFLIDNSYNQFSAATSTTITYPMQGFPITNLATNNLRIEYTVNGAASDVYLELVRREGIR